MGSSCGNDRPVNKPRGGQRFTADNNTENIKVGTDDMDTAAGIKAAEFRSAFLSGKYFVLYFYPVTDNMAGVPFNPDHAANVVFCKQNIDGNPVMSDDHSFFAFIFCHLFLCGQLQADEYQYCPCQSIKDTVYKGALQPVLGFSHHGC